MLDTHEVVGKCIGIQALSQALRWGGGGGGGAKLGSVDSSGLKGNT